MKKIIAFFLLFAVKSWALFPDANAVAYYGLSATVGGTLDVTDSSGNGYNGSIVGALTCNGSPFYSAGPFSDSNYVQLPSGFRTAWSALTAWTIEFQIKFTNLAHNTIPIDFDSTPTQSTIQFYTDGSIHATIANADVATATGLITTGTRYNIAVTGDNTSLKIYVNNSLTRTATGTWTLAATVHSRIGQYQAATGLWLDGQISQVLYSNTVRTSFPTVPLVTPTNTPTLTNSPTLTATPTLTNSPTLTTSPTLTASPTFSNSPTLTYSPTLTASPTLTSSPTPTASPTSTATPTITSTATPTPMYQALNLKLNMGLGNK